MMAAMCGASVFSIMDPTADVRLVLIPAFGLAAACLGGVALLVGKSGEWSRVLVFFLFLIFEFTVGVYWPAMGVIKSRIVPEEYRSTIYNIYRVPLNGVVLGVLLSNISLTSAFTVCSSLLFFATLGMFLMRVSTHLPGSEKGTSKSA